MKTETSVLDPIESNDQEEEKLKIRKITVGAFEGQTSVEIYGSALACGTCANTGCKTWLICSQGCDSSSTT